MAACAALAKHARRQVLNLRHMFYLHHTPWWLRALFPAGLQWEGPAPAGREVYLTFDDGPHPVATPFVLDQLGKAGMQGTFFCIGKNVQAHPDIYQQLQAEGHAVGNHTMHHANAAKKKAAEWVDDISKASTLIQSHLFRPPYGQLPHRHARQLRQAFPDMKIVMWSMLTGDFDTGIAGERCFKAVERHVRPGSIIVFHDSAKAMDRLQVALPLTLQWLQEKGYRSLALS